MNGAYYFTVFISVICPLGILALVLFKTKDLRKAYFLGILSFSISQLLIRIPMIQYGLSFQPWYILLSMKYPVLYILFLSFTAGLFEEFGRYFIFKKFLPSLNLKQILLFGLGHGGIEAFVLVGLPFLYVGSTTILANEAFYAGLERISALIIHVSLSFFVYQSISKKTKIGLILAIMIHTLSNFLALIFMMQGVSIWMIEIGLLLISLILLITSLKERIEYEKNND